MDTHFEHGADTEPVAAAVRLDPELALQRLASLSDPDLLRLPLRELLDQTLDRLLDIFAAEACAIFVLDPADTEADTLARRGAGVAFAALDHAFGAQLAGRVASAAKPVVADARQSSDFLGAAVAATGAAAMLGVPLVAGRHALGALVVATTAPGGLTVDDAAVLSLAATHVALALDHGVLLDAERRARATAEAAMKRLGRLQRLTATLAGTLTETDIVRVVVSDGLQLLDALAGAVWTVTGDRLRLTGATGYPSEVTRRLSEIALDAPYPVALAARERRPVLLRSTAERDAQFPSLADEPAVGLAFAALPLTFGGDLVGVLSASFVSGELLVGATNLEFLDAIAGQAAVALHRVSVLAAEREARRLEQEAVHRLGRLQAFTSALSSASHAAEVADVAVREFVAELGVERCLLAVLDDERQVLSIVGSSGVDPASLDRFATIPLDRGLPAADVVLDGRPVAVHSRAERDARYPLLVGVPPSYDHTLAVLPLMVEGEPVGAISLSFRDVRPLDDDDMALLMALAGQCAQAIERSRLREGQRRSRRQLALLAETGRLFATSLDLDSTLKQVCRLLAPAVVDVASAQVFDGHGQLRLAAYAVAEQATEVALLQLWQRLGDDDHRRFVRLIEAGEPVLRTPSAPADPAGDARATAEFEALDLRSSVLLPLRARGRSVGLISVATRPGRPPLGEADVPFLTELAARVALAVDNARLFRNQAEIAHTLQRSLLPAELPSVDGAEVAVTYLPGMEGTTVGGDFYDVIPLPSGRVGLVIGDVMGRGVRAAAVMGQLRAAVRSYALEGHGPSALLARLDRLVTTLEEGLLVTCVYGEWDPAHATVTLACAGHLPPLVRLPGQDPRYLDIDPGVPLGVGSLAASDVDLELPPGSLLLAYTDGIVESPDLPLQQGMAALTSAVADAPPTASEVCRLAIERLRGGSRYAAPAGERRHDDDIALLALVTLNGGDSHSTAVHRSRAGLLVELPADPSSPAEARDAIYEALDRWGMTSVADTAVLLVSELVTNAVRHAGTALRLSMHRPSPGRVRIEVLDHAPHALLRPTAVPANAEGGRGLFLVQALAAAWGSESVPGGKSVWFELDDAG